MTKVKDEVLIKAGDEVIIESVTEHKKVIVRVLDVLDVADSMCPDIIGDRMYRVKREDTDILNPEIISWRAIKGIVKYVNERV